MSGRAFWTDAEVRAALELPADAAAAGGVTFPGVSTDTRTVRPGELFVALAGERFDAHDFLDQAVAGGAAGVVVERVTEALAAAPQVVRYVVPDTLTALGRLARHRRRGFTAPVCAITGTVGKTTTKEMARAVAATRYRVHATKGNMNNLVGAPLTLLQAPDDAEALVIEVGTNAPGEIARLAAIVEPDVAMITAVAEGHLEGLGTVAGVLSEKCALLGGLRPGGLALVADEPPELVERARREAGRVLAAGWSERADPELKAEAVTVDDDGRVSFRWAGRTARLASRGRSNARNALLALGLGVEWGVDPDAALVALAAVQPPSMRAEVLHIGALRVIADCYNSNPSSLAAALDLLVSMRRGAGRVAVVGSMLELGPAGPELHRRAAEDLAGAGLDIIVATGEFVPAFQPLAGGLGDRLILATDPLDAYPRLAARLAGDEVILLKGSRGVALERLLPLLERDGTPASPVDAAGDGGRAARRAAGG